MPIIKCPNCRRYDPGVDDRLDDLPEDTGLAERAPGGQTGKRVSNTVTAR